MRREGGRFEEPGCYFPGPRIEPGYGYNQGGGGDDESCKDRIGDLNDLINKRKNIFTSFLSFF